MRVEERREYLMAAEKKDLCCTVNINLPSDGTVKEVSVKDVVIDGTRASIKLSLKLA